MFVLYFHEDIKPMERGDAMSDLSEPDDRDSPLHKRARRSTVSQTLIQNGEKLAPSSQIIVGYYQSRFQPSDFSNLMQDEAS